MSVELVFIGKLLLCFFLTGLIFFVSTRADRFRHRLAGQETRWLTGAFVVFRLVPFVVVYLILDESPRGDVPFFYEKGANALQGGLVYVDFWSFHAPGFAYILALPLLIWHSAKAIVLLMLLGEWLTVHLTFRLYAARSGKSADESALSALLYWLQPAPLVICLLGGQEDIWLWLFGLLSVLVLNRGQQPAGQGWFRVGLVMAAALLCLKVTFAMILFPVFFLVRDKVRFVRALALVGIPALLGLYIIMGTAFLMPMQHGDLPFSPNLSTVLRPFLGFWMADVPLKTLNWIGLCLTLALLIATGLSFRHLPYQQAFPAIWIITFGWFMLLQASAMAYYIFIFLVAFVFELVPLSNRRRIAWLVVINWLVVVQPFVSVYYGQPLFNSPGQLASPVNLLVYALEAATVGCVGGMVWLAYKRLTELNVVRRPEPISQE
ncbi:hypothetical protein DYU11_29400 [Fibrisoma montanum]|uniref:DUF2029 domain-containing protein n=1 Tax=Fibrisoma montanum TaxID=2305895 RepID=A0A418LXW9_9BACT|nr:hypothetical protein [Fibrisoma montanum]RIV18075.1 hypothetical protein DYU11_29400 [Fibrisoma montanum]